MKLLSDCRYVVDGINEGRQKWRARAWFSSPQEARLVANADLWREVDRLLTIREEPFTVQWTKGHPLRQHVQAQESTPLHAYGNVGADFLAGAAAATEDLAALARAARQAQVLG